LSVAPACACFYTARRLPGIRDAADGKGGRHPMAWKGIFLMPKDRDRAGTCGF
jgi:hypothetical protein